MGVAEVRGGRFTPVNKQTDTHPAAPFASLTLSIYQVDPCTLEC
jgi:hypothetical protein